MLKKKKLTLLLSTASPHNLPCPCLTRSGAWGTSPTPSSRGRSSSWLRTLRARPPTLLPVAAKGSSPDSTLAADAEVSSPDSTAEIALDLGHGRLKLLAGLRPRSSTPRACRQTRPRPQALGAPCRRPNSTLAADVGVYARLNISWKSTSNITHTQDLARRPQLSHGVRSAAPCKNLCSRTQATSDDALQLDHGNRRNHWFLDRLY